jgi:hypothetical protein
MRGVSVAAGTDGARAMTLFQFVREWERTALVAIRNGMPAPAALKDVEVIFPDGSPVRRVEYGFVGGRVCLIVSGERK